MNNVQITTLSIGLITFIMGILTGYVLHDFMKRTLSMSEDSSKNFLLLIVTLIWMLSMLVSIFNPAYQTPIPVHGMMGAIVGFFFYKGRGEQK